VTSWSEIHPGSFRGAQDHEKALKRAGYEPGPVPAIDPTTEVKISRWAALDLD